MRMNTSRVWSTYSAARAHTTGGRVDGEQWEQMKSDDKRRQPGFCHQPSGWFYNWISVTAVAADDGGHHRHRSIRVVVIVNNINIISIIIIAIVHLCAKKKKKKKKKNEQLKLMQLRFGLVWSGGQRIGIPRAISSSSSSLSSSFSLL